MFVGLHLNFIYDLLHVGNFLGQILDILLLLRGLDPSLDHEGAVFSGSQIAYSNSDVDGALTVVPLHGTSLSS